MSGAKRAPLRDNLNHFKTLKDMKTDIVLAGVGGQGILSIATILGAAALKDNLHIK